MGSNLSISLQMTRDILNRYFVTTIFAMGIVGSLLNIRLFTRPRLRANSCCSCKYLVNEKDYSMTV